MRFSRALALCLTLLCGALAAGCAAARPEAAAPAIIRRAEAVPYPARPDFPAFCNGDFVCMTQPARERLARRHTLVVWYMRELEAALAAYDGQSGAAVAAPQHNF